MRILDTDFCIEWLRGTPSAVERMKNLGEDVATTVVTAAELFYGVERSGHVEENRRLVKVFLAGLDVFGLDLEAAETYGRIRADLEARGSRLPDNDLLIAAIALSMDAVVVTGNVSHLGRVPGLRVEDYRA